MPLKVNHNKANETVTITVEDLSTIICALADGYFSNEKKYPCTAKSYWSLRDKCMVEIKKTGFWYEEEEKVA